MYESYYKLSGKPFQLNPDPAFFFGSRGHKRAIAYLQYGVYQSEGFIVVTGEVGAGKTTLIRSLLEQLDPSKFVAAQLVSTQLDAEDTLRAVAGAFGLPIRANDKAQLLSDLEKFFVSLRPENKRALLIVDEAQNLTPRAVEELRMLSNFQVGEYALLQSFLVGQPELRQTMRSPHMQQLRQRVIASYHLGPIDRNETEAYIKHRLAHVGWNDDPKFATSAFDAIYAFTTGIPRRINTLCNRLMLAGYLSESHLLTAQDVNSIVAEIEEELGADLARTGISIDNPLSMGSTQIDAVNGAARMTELDSVYLPKSGLAAESSSGIKSSNQAVVNIHIEERVRRLEKAMVATLSALQRLVSPESPQQPEDRVET